MRYSEKLLRRFSGIAHGLEGPGPRADGAEPRGPQPLDRPADAGKALQVAAELVPPDVRGVRGRLGEGDAILPELLVTEILPQKASRVFTSTRVGASFEACSRIGTFSFERFTSSTTAISSPKLGRQMTRPSISSECLRK